MAPSGPVYQAGTLSGNPVAVAAGLATLKALQQDGTYEQLEAKGAWLEAELVRATAQAGAEVTINRAGSLLTVFFTGQAVHDLEDARQADLKRFQQFFQGMLARGIYLPPSQFEAWFISLSHSHEDLEQTAAAAREVFSKM